MSAGNDEAWDMLVTMDAGHTCVPGNVFLLCQWISWTLWVIQRYCQKSKFESFMNAEPSSPSSSTPSDQAATGHLVTFVIACPAMLCRRHRGASSLGLAYRRGGWGGLGWVGSLVAGSLTFQDVFSESPLVIRQTDGSLSLSEAGFSFLPSEVRFQNCTFLNKTIVALKEL